MHYLVDGYNLLFHLQFHKLRSLQQQRTRLLDYLSKQTIRSKSLFTIVFDASDEHASAFPSSHSLDNLEIVFVPEEKMETDDSEMADEITPAPVKEISSESSVQTELSVDPKANVEFVVKKLGENVEQDESEREVSLTVEVLAPEQIDSLVRSVQSWFSFTFGFLITGFVGLLQ